MQLKRIGLWLLILIIIGTVFDWKAWQKQTASNILLSTQVKGPAVLLFRGDNSPSCQAIHDLVDQAAEHYSKQINFV
jgi:predicted negative regulator of RcsB-dependent stress response